eukprot:GHVP01011519.1.p1 GENE.GHVP01011519.1~~GHVP01011519.1.p1  ORF type:complete len:549 (+),score=99.22 GHVP01011519.1:254-1900(+)
MGVNMPARSVVFTSVTKHDGTKNRMLSASEYTQMSGRAGRRGKDDFGNVYIFCPDEPPELNELRPMLVEKANPLESRFRLTFQMMLQLCNRRTIGIDEMMSRSYKESLRSKQLPLAKRDLLRRQHDLKETPKIKCIFGLPTMKEYANAKLKSDSASSKLNEEIYSKTLFPGRVCTLHSLPIAKTNCHGVLVRHRTGDLSSKKSEEPSKSGSRTNSFVVLHPPGLSEEIHNEIEDTSIRTGISGVLGALTSNMGTVSALRYSLLHDVPLDNVATISNEVLDQTCFVDFEDTVALISVARSLDTLIVGNGGDVKPFEIPKSMKELASDFFEAILDQKDLQKKISSNKCHTCPLREEHFNLQVKTENLVKKIQELKFLIRNESLDLYPEMLKKIEVLKIRGFIDDQECVTMKGRVACELLTSDELTLVEVVFSGILKGLEPEELVSLLSCFVFPEKLEETPMGPTGPIADGRTAIEEIHGSIEKAMVAMGVKVGSEDWWKLCNFRLCNIAYEWAKGTPFTEIMKTCDKIQEGTIVRAILRLDELLRKMKQQ